MTSEDITDEYVNGLNDPEINRFLVEVKRNRQTHDTVHDYILQNQANPNSLLLAVHIRQNASTLIGTVRMHEISSFHFCASVGICIFRKTLWGQGIGAEALTATKDFAFKRLGLHYLEAGVYAENLSSIRVFQKAGFRETHRNTQKYRFENGFVEVIFFGALSPSFNFNKLKED